MNDGGLDGELTTLEGADKASSTRREHRRGHLSDSVRRTLRDEPGLDSADAGERIINGPSERPRGIQGRSSAPQAGKRWRMAKCALCTRNICSGRNAHSREQSKAAKLMRPLQLLVVPVAIV